MRGSKLWHFGKYGMETLFFSIRFFYRHFSLLLVALIPSSVRAYQMLNELQTPYMFEVIVALTRVLLFLLIIRLMTNVNLKILRDKNFWEKLGKSCSLHVKNNWPDFTLAQIVIFLVFLYGLGNIVIHCIVHFTLLPLLNVMQIESVEHTIEAARNAYLFFLKNMSIIPLAMVYILAVLGAGLGKHH